MLVKACNALGVLAPETAFIGDTITDAQAARAAGCLFVGYRLEAANTVRELNELLKLTSVKSDV